jgi:ribosomal protein S27AE
MEMQRFVLECLHFMGIFVFIVLSTVAAFVVMRKLLFSGIKLKSVLKQGDECPYCGKGSLLQRSLRTKRRTTSKTKKFYLLCPRCTRAFGPSR